MTATSRSQLVELNAHTSVQLTILYLLAATSILVLFVFVAAPMLDVFFSGFLRSDVIRDGRSVTYRVAENRAEEVVETGTFTTWALADPRTTNVRMPHAEYIFKPVIALAPLVVVCGFLVAALLTAFLPRRVGYLRQKIEREILVALDKLAMRLYGEHTADEVRGLTKEICTADARKLHDLADTYGIAHSDLELLQKALIWRDAKGADQLLKTHHAVKFYMREYFTDRYSNAVLGMVYMGAAVLIIVIGIRGLKFLPATDPSVVLSALGLEFMLLVTYAAILMYGRTEESSMVAAPHSSVIAELDRDADTEQLIRAFLAVPRLPKEE